MLFNSFSFVLFYVVVTSLYFILPHKFRWFLLLMASCYFYMAFVPIYILILGFTIIVDYFAGIAIEKTAGKLRRSLLVLSLISNIGILVFFKYFNFLNANINAILHGLHYHNPIPFLSILLPIGLSFHTFQAMSYTIEVYRGNQKAEKHFGIYSLYVMFYPQLVAGPIERPQNLLHQFREKHNFDYSMVTSGLKLMAWGLFKKVVIADRLALFVNLVYARPENHDSLTLLIAIIFFPFQIYCDFSGYTDIARGAARTMGFSLMRNFNGPFMSGTIGEFWRRWHISLSTWFFDYLYNPLAIYFRNMQMLGIALALFITFFLSGLWHGAGWTFIIYGIMHGIAIIYELYTKKLRKRLFKPLPKRLTLYISQVIVFFYVAISWVFFRSPHVSTAFYIIKRIALGGHEMIANIRHRHLGIDYNRTLLVMSILLIVFIQAFQVLQSKVDLPKFFKGLPGPARWTVYYAFILIILIFGVFNNSQFIYFQF